MCSELENALLGLRPQAAFSRPQSQILATLMWTSKPANNINVPTTEPSTIGKTALIE